VVKLAQNQISIYDDITLQTSIASQYLQVRNDFLFGLGEFSSFTSGAGTGVSFGTANTSNHPGIATLTTGSTASGSARIGLGSTGGAAILFGFAEWKFEASVMVPVLSNVTDKYRLEIGFVDQPTPIDGVFFRYNYDEASARWQACTRINNNTLNSFASGGIVAANQWYRLSITVNQLGTLATFFIDGTEIGSTSISIPVGAGRQTGIASIILKGAGTTPSLLHVDFMDVVAKFTTPR
jgi:hypothetical protein